MPATQRWVLVWATETNTGAPPGISPRAFARACVEDVVELVSALVGVQPALACPPQYPRPEELVWPGTPVLRAADPAAALAQAHRGGASAAVVVAGDAPDLPLLLIGKVFAALAGAPVAVTPCAGGGLVTFAARLPYLGAVDLDAPAPAGAAHGPGWHRLRAPQDISRLDAGLEGWDATRALLSGWAQPGPAVPSVRGPAGGS